MMKPLLLAHALDAVLVLDRVLSPCLQDAASWGLKLEALKLVQTYVQFFSKLVAPHLPPLMAQAWHLFLASQPVYQHHVINNTPDLDADQVLAAATTALLLLTDGTCSAAVAGLISSRVCFSRCQRSCDRVLSTRVTVCLAVNPPSWISPVQFINNVCTTYAQLMHTLDEVVLPEAWQYARWQLDDHLVANIEKCRLVAVLMSIIATCTFRLCNRAYCCCLIRLIAGKSTHIFHEVSMAWSAKLSGLTVCQALQD